jgi:hypothetical protein
MLFQTLPGLNRGLKIHFSRMRAAVCLSQREMRKRRQNFRISAFGEIRSSLLSQDRNGFTQRAERDFLVGLFGSESFPKRNL